MADDDRLLELERLQHVERVQGDVEHVAQPVLARRLAVTGQQRRDDAVFAASAAISGSAGMCPPAPWR